MRKIAQRLCSVFLKELRNLKKLIYNALSSMGGKLSNDKVTKGDIRNWKKIVVANDLYELTFGVLIDKIKKKQNIGWAYAEGVIMSRKNSDFASSLKKLGKESKFAFQYSLLASSIYCI